MASQRIKGITIEIGGDTSNLVKALASVDSAARATKNNLNDINRALKLDPTNVELIKAKENELAKSVEEAEEKVKKEKEALEQLNEKLDQPFDLDHAAEFEKNAKAAEDLKLQIELDTVALEQAQKALKDFGSVGAQHLQAVGKQMEEIGNKVKGVGDNMASLGRDITTKVSVPIATAFTGAVKVTADFDSQMSKVRAISGATGEQFEELRAKAREMGASTKFSATEAGQAFEYMGMAGWKSDQMIAGLPAILNLAASSGEELGTTSDIVTDALTAFGLGAEDASRFTDILASAATNANTNVSMMGESFKYAAPVAGSLGYSAEDVAVALGLMANAGIKADMAGTSLRNVFQRMATEPKQAEQAMQRLGVALYDDAGKMYSFREIMEQLRTSFANINIDIEEYDQTVEQLDADLEAGRITQKKYDAELEELNKQAFGAEGAEKARAAAMLGGSRAMSGLLAITEASKEDFNKLVTAVDNSSQSFAKLADGSVVPLNEALASGAEVIETYNGQAEAMAATMQDNLGGDITTLMSALQELAISFGDLLMPTIREVVSGIQGVVDWLNSLDEGTKNTIVKIALVVAAIGPVILVIGKVVGAIGTVINVVGTIMSAIGAILPVLSTIAGVITGTVIPAIAAIGAPVLIVVGVIGALIAIIVLCIKHWDEIKAKAKEVTEFMAKAWGDFKNKFTEHWNNMKNHLSSKINEMSNNWNTFKGNVANVWNNIKSNTASRLNEMGNNWNNFRNTLSNVWNNIKSNISSSASAIFSSVTSAFSNIYSGATGKLQSLLSGAVSIFNNMRSSISSVIGSIYSTIVSGFSNAVSYITSLPSRALGWGRDIINGIVNGIRSAFSNLVNAVSDIAETIASYIHFSEPDKGALSDFHTFMPDMMRQLAQGIKNGIPQIDAAMDSMTRSMTPSMGGAGTTNNTTSNAVSINVYGAQGQNMDELAQIIEDKITNNVVRRGVAFG